ncbi:MAG: Smr/MutS family protein [Gemmatimonadetes bacterium]|nr:Smr/MutS family protein [Gemmatimonadota bacterium]
MVDLSEYPTEGVQVTAFTGTPSAFREVADRPALAQLELAAALECVAAFAAGPHGAERVRARRPVADLQWIRSELDRVRQLSDLLGRGDGFRPEAVASVERVLSVLAADGAVLEGPELAELRRTLEAMHLVSAELRRIAKEAPAVAALAVELPPRELTRLLAGALEPDGAVRDGASPQLARARRKVRDTRARLVALLDGLLRSLGPQHAPPEGTVTVRGGRYVIPVFRESRTRAGGIVHGESGSGATLFVEPAAAVEVGNELAEAEAEEARAVLAVLRDLTATLRPEADRIASGWEMCVAADDVYARARYGSEVKGSAPRLAPAPAALGIRNCRHPLLLAELGHAVPFDLELTDAETAVIISGPNTGGKTVLLKAIGLVAALTQSGVIPPVGEGTELPVFQRIFSDIGDRQSIAESLSTFSGHLQNLKAMLQGADAASLVLLDELGSGTDPFEGGALAAAVIVALVARHSLTIATTHLSQLKELATTSTGVVNASLRFDGEEMRPTYELVKGVPGRSYGLAIARRLGLPDDVLAEAESRRPAQERSLDELLAQVEATSAALALREREVAEREESIQGARGDLEALREELETRAAGLSERERELQRSAREQARAFLLQARKRVEEALGMARAAVSEASAKEARRLVEEGVKSESEAVKKLKEAAEKKGWKVSGEWDMVRGGSGAPTPTASQKPSTHRAPRTSHRESAAPASEVDLRGMTGDEAEVVLLRALDDAILAELPHLRIIHGKGTGALRVRVGQLLKADRRVRSFALAPAQQGGSGVTIAEFQP